MRISDWSSDVCSSDLAVIMIGGQGDGAGAAIRNGDRVRGGIKAVVPILLLQPVRQCRFLLDIERVERLAIAVLGRAAEPGGQFAVQPVGRPVGRLRGAAAPARARLHSAGALPPRLPGPNTVKSGKEPCR